MKSKLCLLLSLVVCAFCTPKKNEQLYQSVQYTDTGIFTTNIEGPAFDREGNLYVVNFEKDGTIGRIDKSGRVSLFLTLPEGCTANSIKFKSNGDMLLADFSGHNILRVDMESKHIDTLVHNPSFNQPNDICINKKDQLFASDPNWAKGTGQIWRIDTDGTAVLLDSAMGTTNGIVLSPDEKTLYVNESIQRNIWAFDVDDEGNLSNKRLVKAFEDFGFDGMKCDANGNLYVTRWGKGTIAVLQPSGELIREIPLNGKNCSNLVFGGPDNKTVFVTLQDTKGMERFINDIPGAN